ncbi:MAG TPA: phosphohydrolase, partial [Ruminiclostridium sp.]|nr:phosphohydrolase [Ruminiclostridium sp.]
ARHSAGVAKTSQRLAEMIGFSPLECKMMLIAGYLHDLGKLAISNDVLEKPAKLNEDEFNEIRSHTYYTYQLLDTIPQFETIKTWAAFHHERLNGSGYPFHIKGDSLTLGSRIMAVADIFTAITESRPYRKGMDDQHAIHALKDMVASEAIDGNIVKVLIDHFQEINDIRESAQQQASNRYESFLHTEAVL